MVKKGPDAPRRRRPTPRTERISISLVLMAQEAWRRPGTTDTPASALTLLQQLVIDAGGDGPWPLRLQGVGGSVHGFWVRTDGSVDAFTESKFERVYPPRTVRVPLHPSPWDPPASWQIKPPNPAPVVDASEISSSSSEEVETGDSDSDGAVDLSRIFTAAAAASTFAESPHPRPAKKPDNTKKEEPS